MENGYIGSRAMNSPQWPVGPAGVGAACANTPRDVSLVQQALDAVAGNLAELEQEAAELDGRLSMVLTPCGPSPNGDAGAVGRMGLHDAGTMANLGEARR